MQAVEHEIIIFSFKLTMKMKWSVSGCTVINLVKLRGDGYYFFPISFMKCTRNWLNIVNFSLAKYLGEINISQKVKSPIHVQHGFYSLKA